MSTSLPNDQPPLTTFQIRVELQPSSSTPPTTQDANDTSSHKKEESCCDEDNHNVNDIGNGDNENGARAFLAYASSVRISREDRQRPVIQQQQQQQQQQTQHVDTSGDKNENVEVEIKEGAEEKVLDISLSKNSSSCGSFLAVFVPPFIVKSAKEKIIGKEDSIEGNRTENENEDDNNSVGEDEELSSSSIPSADRENNDNNTMGNDNMHQHLSHGCFSWIGSQTVTKIVEDKDNNDSSSDNHDEVILFSPLDFILPRIHPSLVGNVRVKGIISLYHEQNTAGGAADIVLLEVALSSSTTRESDTKGKNERITNILNDLNGETISNVSYAILKALPISCVSFFVRKKTQIVVCTDDDIRNSSKTNERYDKENIESEVDNDGGIQGGSLPPLSTLSLSPSKNVVTMEVGESQVVAGQQLPSPLHHDIDVLGGGFDQHKRHEIDDTLSSDIPPCPVCLHRIDPQRLGLPRPKSHHLCSHLCASGGGKSSCPNSNFLTPWPEPCYCDACHLIDRHSNGDLEPILKRRKGPLCCYKCKMGETLWVCLTCGEVGCGRYSHGHAEAHYLESGHPYSLELVTQRIWDYDTGEFAQRGDLLKCPSLQQQLPHLAASSTAVPVGRRRSAVESTVSTTAELLTVNNVGSSRSIASDTVDHIESNGFPPSGLAAPSTSSATVCSGIITSNDMHQQTSSCDCHDAHAFSAHRSHSDCDTPNNFHIDDTPPKKATMIGEEYEVLLQSALEDQAQHYEGEISRLRAELTAEQVDGDQMSENERIEVESLRSTISELRREADHLGRKVLEVQGQEAGYRATYNRLLREQAVMKDILEKIRVDAAEEHEAGKRQVEDLEQQVSDLKANLKMRQQILGDQELSNAQIFGTTTSPSASTGKSSKRGKKQRRSVRR